MHLLQKRGKQTQPSLFHQIRSQDAPSALGVQRQLHIRQKIVRLQAGLQLLKLGIGPALLGKSLPNRMNGDMHTGNADHIGNKKRFGSYGVRGVKRQSYIGQGFFVLLRRKFGASPGFQAQACLLDFGEVRQKDRPRILHIIDNRITRIRPGAGLIQFIENGFVILHAFQYGSCRLGAGCQVEFVGMKFILCFLGMGTDGRKSLLPRHEIFKIAGGGRLRRIVNHIMGLPPGIMIEQDVRAAPVFNPGQDKRGGGKILGIGNLFRDVSFQIQRRDASLVVLAILIPSMAGAPVDDAVAKRYN